MMDYIALYQRAEEVLKYAYAPYSNFQVGAALLCEDGSIYTGVNIENSSFGATICAERSAMAAAISEGHRKFQAIAVASSAGQSIPCGICRQFLFEFGSQMQVITGKDKDHLKIYTVSELLMEGFRL